MEETKSTNKERLREITAGIEEGIKELFESDKYMQYLRTMSRFHRYSVNNQMLINMQRPNATRVAGFNKWRDQFGRSVKKGEKGIKIIAPTPFKKKIEEIKLDPDTKAPVLDKDGNAVMEEKEIQIPMFKVVTVFDVSQTVGKPLPQLASDLTGDVRQYEVFMEALRRSTPVPMELRPIERDTDGYFSRTEQNIVIRAGMSEVQTVSAAVHEIAHAKLHNYELEREAAAAGDENAQPVKKKNRNTEEVEAESISYTVCQYYGIQTGENSFGYIAGWSKGKELAELRASLETINKTASSLINDIDRHFTAICKERGIDLTAEQAQESPEAEAEAPEPAREAAGLGHHRYYITQEALGHGAYPLMEGYQLHETVELTSYEDGRVQAYGYIDYPQPLTPEQAAKHGLLPADGSAPAKSYEERLLLVDNSQYLHIQQCDGGYDYTFYDKETLREMDGGRFDDPGLPIAVVSVQICDMHKVGESSLKYAPLEIMEQIWEAEDRLQERLVALWEQQHPPSPYPTEPPHKPQIEELFERLGIEEPQNDAPLGGGKIVGAAVRPYDPSAQPGQEQWSEPASVENAPERPGLPSDDVSTYLPEHKLDEYPMPDPRITVEDMKSYGYLEDDMLPVSKDLVAGFLEKDIAVYMLYDDNTEEMVFDDDDILTHDGYFGIDRKRWEEGSAFMEQVRARLDRQEEREAAFLAHEGDCFALYQLQHGDEQRFLRYEPLERLRAAGESPRKGNYDLVYTAPLEYPGTINEHLDDLWETFNRNSLNSWCPADYHSPSMSVSDIVAIKQDGVVSCHYVDRYGFTELPGFFEKENHLKNAEMSMEDDYGMIDGIINNGKAPTVAEQERQEKRPSVLDQLKKHQPQQEHKKTAPKKSAEREL